MDAFMDRNGQGLAFIAGVVLFAAFLWLRNIELFWGSLVLVLVAVVGPSLSKLTAGPIILEFKRRVARQLARELTANLGLSGALETKYIPATEQDQKRRRELIDKIVEERLPESQTPEQFSQQLVTLMNEWRLPPNATIAPSEHLAEDDPRAKR